MGLGDKLEHTPISEYLFQVKVDYRSYFKMMGVPEYDSLMFRKRILNRNIGGALLAIRNSVKGVIWKHHIRSIFYHLVNAVERRDGLTIYVRKRRVTKRYHDTDLVNDFVARRNAIKAAAKAFDKKFK